MILKTGYSWGMRRIVAVWCLLFSLLNPSAVAAGDADGPPAATVRAGPVTVVHAEGDAGFARAVAALAAAAHERIRDDLGLEHRVEAAILLLTANSPAATREEWARRLPSWMAGAAIPARQFIIVRVAPGQTPRGLEPLLAHELTHVILKADYRRHDGWPLWFQEGLAMRESRTEGWREYLTLSAAALFDRMLPLESLSASFPAAEAEARLAYAQSASFLAFLEARSGRGRFADLMRELRRRDFEDAFRATYGTGVGAAEGQWLRWVNRRFAWVPAVTSETAFWLLMTLLFLVAIAVRRRRSRLMRERWERRGGRRRNAGRARQSHLTRSRVSSLPSFGRTISCRKRAGAGARLRGAAGEDRVAGQGLGPKADLDVRRPAGLRDFRRRGVQGPADVDGIVDVAVHVQVAAAHGERHVPLGAIPDTGAAGNRRRWRGAVPAGSRAGHRPVAPGDDGPDRARPRRSWLERRSLPPGQGPRTRGSSPGCPGSRARCARAPFRRPRDSAPPSDASG